MFNPPTRGLGALSQYFGMFGKLSNGKWFTAYYTFKSLDALLQDGSLRKVDDPRTELKYRLKLGS